MPLDVPRKRRKVSPPTESNGKSKASPSASDHLLDQDAIRRHMLELMQRNGRGKQSEESGSEEEGDEEASENEEDTEDGEAEENDRDSGSGEEEDLTDLENGGAEPESKADRRKVDSDTDEEGPSESDSKLIKAEHRSKPVPNATSTLKSRITILPKSQTQIHPNSSSPDIKPKIHLKQSFSELGIGPRLISALASISIKKPTEIQSACIEPILSGRDCIGGAKTGSGKTMAFALPILQRISRDPFGIFAVVLTPTRELAFQLAEQFIVLGKPLGFTTTTIVGGLDMMTQARELCEKPHVVVATPGRLCDLLRSSANGQWDLSRVKVLVLDEADRMLTPTFAPDLKFLFSSLPADRQTLLFTATISPQIEALAERPPSRKGKQKPFVYRIESDTLTVKNLRQEYLFIPGHIRDPYLYYLLTNPPKAIAHLRYKNREGGKKRGYRDEDEEDEDEEEEIPSTIIFTQRCQTAHLLHLILTELSIPSVPLHSHLSQPERLASLARFRAGSVPVLVTTDVGSRGLDIPEVAMVINFDCPRTGEDYVHRVGRTARAGRGGLAVTIVTERDVDLVKGIEELTNVKLTEMDLPEEKVLENLNPVATARRVANLAMQDSAFGERQAVNKAKDIKRRRRDAKLGKKA